MFRLSLCLCFVAGNRKPCWIFARPGSRTFFVLGLSTRHEAGKPVRSVHYCNCCTEPTSNQFRFWTDQDQITMVLINAERMIGPKMAPCWATCSCTSWGPLEPCHMSPSEAPHQTAPSRCRMGSQSPPLRRGEGCPSKELPPPPLLPRHASVDSTKGMQVSTLLTFFHTLGSADYISLGLVRLPWGPRGVTLGISFK